MSTARRIRHALIEALELDKEAPKIAPVLDTVDVDGAASLLHTTARAIYMRHQRGRMPKPLPGRRLVWRRADLLRSEK